MDGRIEAREVEQVARLARLELSAEEQGRMREQLDRILGYIDKLRRLETEGAARGRAAAVRAGRGDARERPRPERRLLPRPPHHRGVMRADGERSVVTACSPS